MDVSQHPLETNACVDRGRGAHAKMTKYVECWGADKPFANITESTLAKNIGLTVHISLKILKSRNLVAHKYEFYTKFLWNFELLVNK